MSTFRAYRELPTPVHLLCLGTLVNRMGTFLIPFLTIYLRDELGLSADVATRGIGAMGLGSLVAATVGGVLADRIGRRVVMLGSLVLSAAVLVLFGELRSPNAILVAAFTFSLFADMYRPASAAMLADLVEPERRGHAFGLMYVAVNLGFTVGAAVGGVVARHSFQWLFWGDAITSCLYAVLILLLIRETLPSRAAATATEDGSPAELPSVAVASALAQMLRHRVFMFYLLATFLGASVFMQFMSTFPLHLRAHGIGTDTYGMIIAVNGAMIVFLQLPMTAFITRFDRGRVMALATFMTGIGFGLVAWSTQVWELLAVVIFLTIAEMMHAPLVQAIVSDLSPSSLRGRYMGALAVSFSLALLIGAPLGGWTLEHLGGGWLWPACFVISCLSAAILYGIRRQIAVRKPAE